MISGHFYSHEKIVKLWFSGGENIVKGAINFFDKISQVKLDISRYQDD